MFRRPPTSTPTYTLFPYTRLFRPLGDSHRAALRLRREAALRALEFFIGFDARLVGPVLDGTADANSPVTLQLYTDDADAVPRFLDEIGRASWRERVCQYVSLSAVAVSIKKNKPEP